MVTDPSNKTIDAKYEGYMFKQEPSTSGGDASKRRKVHKADQVGNLENVQDPKILEPQRDYTNFGYQPESRAQAQQESIPEEPTQPVTESAVGAMARNESAKSTEFMDELEEFKRIEESLATLNKEDDEKDLNEVQNMKVALKNVKGKMEPQRQLNAKQIPKKIISFNPNTNSGLKLDL